MGFFFGDGPTSACAKQPQGPIHCSWAPRTSKLQAPLPTLDRISIFAASRLPPRRRPQTRYPYPPCRYRSPTVKRRMATRARQRPSSSYVAVLPPPSSVFVVVLVSTRQLRFARADLLLTALIPGRRLLARHPLQAPLPRRPQGWLRPSPRRLSVSPAPANGSELDSPSSMSPATPSSGTP